MIYLLEDFENYIDSLHSRNLITPQENQFIKAQIEWFKQEEDDSEETNKWIDHEKDSPF